MSVATPTGPRFAVDPEEATRRFWRALASRVTPAPALWGFALVVVFASLVVNVAHRPFERALRAANIAMRGVDVFEDVGPGAFLLRDFLVSRPEPGTREIAVLGGSLTATSAEPDPRRRLNQALAEALRARTGYAWRGVNLASNGYNEWSSFFVTRLLRRERRPDVLVVGLDVSGSSDANLGLALAAGTRLRCFSARELLPAIAANRQPLVRTEAAALEALDRSLPACAALARARPRNLLNGVVTFARRGFRPAVPPRAVCWRDAPVSRALVERLAAASPIPLEMRLSDDLERLGAELACLSREGTRVLVITLPRNPVIPRDNRPADRELNAWAARHGLDLALYWESDLIPTGHFVDTEHFDGEGAGIFAAALAGRVLRSSL